MFIISSSLAAAALPSICESVGSAGFSGVLIAVAATVAAAVVVALAAVVVVTVAGVGFSEKSDNILNHKS